MHGDKRPRLEGLSAPPAALRTPATMASLASGAAQHQAARPPSICICTEGETMEGDKAHDGAQGGGGGADQNFMVLKNTKTDVGRCAAAHGLTDMQSAALLDMVRAVRRDALPLAKFACSRFETPAFYCQRFLRARAFDVEAALAMLREDLAWRDEYGVLELAAQTPKDFCGCEPKLLFERLPILAHGTDKRGRPVVYKHFGASCKIAELLKHTTEDLLVRFHIWQNERAIRRLAQASEAQGKNVETWQIVIDASGWYLGLATGGALGFLRKIAAIDSDHYPERLGRLTVVNAPWVLSGTWMMIRSWLDARQQAKISIMSGQSSWEKVLKDEHDGIPEAALPARYGGLSKIDYGDGDGDASISGEEGEAGEEEGAGCGSSRSGSAGETKVDAHQLERAEDVL